MPAGITALVLATALFPAAPIRDAVTFQPPGEARLDFPVGYLVIEPISSVLDTITLLTVGQHIALLLWVIAIFAAVRVMFARRRGSVSIKRESIAAALFLVTIVAVYAVGAVAPRPMAQLVLSDPTVLSVDFHAHTKYSHDGRAGWTANDVRDWYRDAGFDAVYITDHRTFEGAERGIADNPQLAGQGTMILQGLEAVWRGEHVNILSAGRRYRGLTDQPLRDVDENSLILSSLIPGNEPVLIETVPGVLSRVADAAAGPQGPGIRAIELIDGSPRGLSQGRAERDRIVHLADSLDLALVAGSDNHGWGRTAAGWTLLRIPEWRGMGTDSLARIIERVIREGRRGATRVVERRVAGGSNPVALAFAGPLIVWRMFTTLSPDERVIWLAWTWGAFLGIRTLRARRRKPEPLTT